MFPTTDELTYGLLCRSEAESAIEGGVDDILPGILSFKNKIQRRAAERVDFVGWDGKRNRFWQGTDRAKEVLKYFVVRGLSLTTRRE